MIQFSWCYFMNNIYNYKMSDLENYLLNIGEKKYKEDWEIPV